MDYKPTKTLSRLSYDETLRYIDSAKRCPNQRWEHIFTDAKCYSNILAALEVHLERMNDETRRNLATYYDKFDSAAIANPVLQMRK